MANSDEKIIPLSKAKLAAIVLGATILAALGLWIAILDEATLLKDAPFGGRVFPFDNPAAMHTIGIAGVVFFSACALFGIVKYFDKNPGLVLGATGFVDNASGVAAGYVPWTEVTQVKTFQVARQRMLIVVVSDPERYIRRGNPFKQAINRMNFNMCGSPITIPSSALKIDFDELSGLFNSYWNRHRAA